ncbi:hypothetical protein FIM12_04005 [SAR202 cluster bacterium AD-804-J14_MRT_500m]|nr:hypothetical protein [SAR202 cluster bacterium AD-804-J14_MRT_500m]
MPNSKGRRLASNQARVGPKRKRGRGPSGVPIEAPQNSNDPTAEEPGHSDSDVMPSAYLSPKKPTSSTAHTVPRSRPTVYRYVNSEIRRILILSSLIVALLLTLSFVLN